MFIRLIQDGQDVRDTLERVVDDVACRRGWRGRPDLWCASPLHAAAWVGRIWPMQPELVKQVRYVTCQACLVGCDDVNLAGFSVRISALVPDGEMWVVWPDSLNVSSECSVERWLPPGHFAAKAAGGEAR